MRREASPESRGVPDTFPNPSDTAADTCAELGCTQPVHRSPRRGDDTVPFRRDAAIKDGVSPHVVNLEPDARGLADFLQKQAINRLATWLPTGLLGRAATPHLDARTAKALKNAHDYLELAVRALNETANDLEDVRLVCQRRASRRGGGR